MTTDTRGEGSASPSHAHATSWWGEGFLSPTKGAIERRRPAWNCAFSLSGERDPLLLSATSWTRLAGLLTIADSGRQIALGLGRGCAASAASSVFGLAKGSWATSGASAVV